MPYLQLLQFLLLVFGSIEVSLGHLIPFLLFELLGVHDRHAHNNIQLGRQVVILRPILYLVLQHWNALLEFLILRLVDFVDAIQSLDRGL